MKQIAFLAALVAVSTPLSARAQSHGVGFPLGEKSRVHTNLDLGVGFDSNPDRFDLTMSGNQQDWKALIRPGLTVNVPGSSTQFDLRAQLTISQFFGTGNKPAETEFGTLIGAKLRAGHKDSVVGFHLDELLVKTPTQIDDLGSFAASERRFKEWANRGKAVLELKPGGGALEFDLGYQNELSIYDDDTLPDSQRHGALFEAKLRFLPKTAVLFHSDISFFSANENTLKSSPLNVTLGLVGQVTSRLTTDLEIGYGDTFTSVGEYFGALSESRTGTIIGRAEITYDLLESSRFTAGFRRQVKPVILLNSYASNSPYVRFVLGVGARLAFGLYGSYEWRDYGGDAADAQLLIGDARVDYWFFEFLTASINYRVIRQDSTAQAGMFQDLLEDYTRHEAMMMVGLRY